MKIHLYTKCWDEAEMLPFFFRHYDQIVDRYIIFDNGSTDGSLEFLREHPKVDLRTFEWLEPESFVLSEQAFFDMVWNESKDKADWVLLVDIDEHLVVSDLTLLDYLIKCRFDGITVIPAIGYQMISEEFPRPDETLSDSYTIGAPFEEMNKLAIFNPSAVETTSFAPGRHTARPTGNIVYPAIDNLMLLHYKFLGIRKTYIRQKKLNTGLKDLDKKSKFGFQYRLTEAQFVSQWNSYAQRAIDIRVNGFSPSKNGNFASPLWWHSLQCNSQHHLAANTVDKERLSNLKDLHIKRKGSVEHKDAGIFYTCPSIILLNGIYYATVKVVNFDRELIWEAGHWEYTSDEKDFLRISNKLLRLDEELNVISSTDLGLDEVELRKKLRDLLEERASLYPEKNRIVVEDLRLLDRNQELSVLGTINILSFVNDDRFGIHLTAILSRQFVADLRGSALMNFFIFASPSDRNQEKNWMSYQKILDLSIFCTNINTRSLISYDFTSRCYKQVPGEDCRRYDWQGGWSGSTALIRHEEGYLGIVHRTSLSEPRIYVHAFVLCDDSYSINKISKPFTFEGEPIEFCCGISRSVEEESLVISYGIWDKTAQFIEIPYAEIYRMLELNISSNQDINNIDFDEDQIYNELSHKLINCVRSRDKIIHSLKSNVTINILSRTKESFSINEALQRLTKRFFVFLKRRRV